MSGETPLCQIVRPEGVNHSSMASMSAAQIEAWANTVRGGLVGPITPEMMDGIRTALANNPTATSFDDAATQYVRILTEELGFDQGTATALVTSKYAPGESDLDAYINARVGM